MNLARRCTRHSGIDNARARWFWKRTLLRLNDGAIFSKSPQTSLVRLSHYISGHPILFLRTINVAMDSKTKPSNISLANSNKIQLNANGSHVQRSQYRHYKPRSISQQATDITIQDEELIEKNNQRTAYKSKDQTFSFHFPVSREYKRARCDLLRRPLGGIEQMYNIYSSQGTDIICLMTKIETIYSVSSTAVIKALELLQQRHPLFRMSIQKSRLYDDGHMDFVENEKAFDFEVHDCNDWLKFMLEELDNHSNRKDQSLIRCRMLNSSPVAKEKECSDVGDHNGTLEANNHVTLSAEQFDYQATFLFIMHHSIMDGGYSLWMFQEFINFLDAVIMNKYIGHVNELPLLPPFENIFTFNCDKKVDRKEELKEISLTFSHDCNDSTILDAYNRTFQNEIEISQSNENTPLKNDCILFKFSETKSRKFLQMVKLNKCTAKGAIIAACTLALLELVYEDGVGEMCNSCSVPIEYMADFRRVGDFLLPDDGTPHYPGVAALHLPLVAQLRLENSKLTAETFWKIAKQFGDSLDSNVDSPEVYAWIKEEASKYNNCPTPDKIAGKSQYVLSISNMGKIDGVLNTDVSGRVRLVDLHGHSSILIDEMPLFCVTTFALNGNFCGNVSFCRNYTSNKTATKYVGLIQKYLCSYSNL